MTFPARKFAALFGPLLVSACGGGGTDPAAQEPVSLEPGLYAVTHAGATTTQFGTQAKSEANQAKDVCITQGERDLMLHRVPRQFYSSMALSCVPSKEERVGNRVTGTVTCRGADGPTVGSMTFAYEGDVAADSVAYRTKMAVEMTAAGKEIDTSALDDMELRLDLKRIGECPGL